jgi:hypothetical protein
MKKRFVFFPLFFAALGFSALVRSSTGPDHVRTVQILALIATGTCLGVALAHLRFLFDEKSRR